MTRISPGLVVMLGLASPACQDSGTLGAREPAPTAISVDPELFLGAVPCLQVPGSLTHYVATLSDVYRTGSTAQEFPLASSGPVPCGESAIFQRVIPGRQYVADIQAYDAPVLRPLVPGSPILLGSDGEVVAPRWETCCGRDDCTALARSADAGTDADTTGVGDAGLSRNSCTIATDGGDPDLSGPTCSVSQRTVPIRGCHPLREVLERDLPTGIAVDTARLAQAIGCGNTPGRIESLQVELLDRIEEAPDAAPPATTLDVECGATAPFLDLDEGEHYAFSVLAFESSATAPGYSTQCYGVAVADLVITASCDPLTPTLQDGGGG